jgi:hypothetical protein
LRMMMRVIASPSLGVARVRVDLDAKRGVASPYESSKTDPGGDRPSVTKVREGSRAGDVLNGDEEKSSDV